MKANSGNFNIGGVTFNWDLNKGKFSYEGRDAVLFWITTAMKTFFDTIEEISGEEASRLVFEASGFRQGVVVGDYFEKVKSVTPDEAIEIITNTYAAAGWGLVKIEELNPESKIVRISLKNSWEYKINVEQGKEIGSNFLPAHYAGVFSGLFGTNMGFDVVQYQQTEHDYTIVEYYPSKVTIRDNVHQLARKKELDQILQLEALVEDKTRDLKNLVKKLSSPFIPVLDEVVVVPLIGEYNEERSEELLEKTITQLPHYQARFLILDLTGVDSTEFTYMATLIREIGSSAFIMGTETILVGITPDLSKSLTKTDFSWDSFQCFHTLQHGIYFALGQLGKAYPQVNIK